ncbi:MAG: DUF192 domain-containing protein [Bacillota bacterium]
MKLINLDNGQVLASQIKEANTFSQRLKGLMFTKNLPGDWGLRIQPCRGIHTFFMQYNIDVLHLDSNQRVVLIEENISPGKVGKTTPATVEIVELNAGKIRETETKMGHSLYFVDEHTT